MTKLEDLKEVEVGGIDLTEFEGKKVRIAEVIPEFEVPSTFNETGKQMCFQIKTEDVTTFEDSEGEEQEICATELLNMKKDENGEWGYSSSPKSKIQKFLKKQGVKHPKDLIGTSVTLRVRKKMQSDGSDKEFLGFYLD